MFASTMWLATVAAHADTPRTIGADEIEGVARAPVGVTLVHVWATWCGYCKSEFDGLDAVSEELPVSVVALSLDRSATPLEQYLSTKDTRWAQYHVTGMTGADLVRSMYDLGGSFSGILPYDLLLDANGRVVDEWSGALSQEDLHQRIAKHVQGGIGGPTRAELAAVEQGLVRLVLAGREGDAVYVDGWNAGVLPLETELVGGLHTFRVEGEQGRVEVDRAIDFSAGTPTLDLGLAGT